MPASRSDSLHFEYSPYASAWLALVGFSVWMVFSALPAWTGHGPRMLREAWDTDAFWLYGVPMILSAQVLAGGFDRGALWREPLWTLAGLFTGLLLIHPRGDGFGMLPVAVVFIGGPAFVLLFVAAAVGRGVDLLTRRWSL